MRPYLLLTLLATSCAPFVVAPDVRDVPPPVEEAEPEPTDCELACARLQELDCEDGEPDAEGNSCVDVCTETQEAGLVDLKPGEIAQAEACPD